MHITTAVAATALALATGASAMLAAPAQTQQPGPTTQQPGQMTEAHVWVDNRGRSQAVPVELSDEKLDHPLRVLIINGEPQYQPSNPVLVRTARPLWEYQTVTLAAGDDMAQKLNPLGAAGWETTTIMSVDARTTRLLLKRPR
jgi:hypothetical protein